jgi:pimeloyl-ACP methyl ester carboxylesterase
MSFSVVVLSALSVAAPPLDTQFVQVAPLSRDRAEARRSPGQDRAVVLIHGFRLHPIHPAEVNRAGLHEWQKPESLFVRRLSREADVYAFAYAENEAADEIGDCPQLGSGVQKLREMGYRSIVLVGHSAGGVVARHFVEDNPDAGVTKVVQVCAPNSGSPWAALAILPQHTIFLDSLTKPVRRLMIVGRVERHIPDNVEFACVVATGLGAGDGLVGTSSQWSEDLQKQGVPAFALRTVHWKAVRTTAGAELVAELVKTPMPRWDSARVAEARKALFGNAAAKMR